MIIYIDDNKADLVYDLIYSQMRPSLNEFIKTCEHTDTNMILNDWLYFAKGHHMSIHRRAFLCYLMLKELKRTKEDLIDSLNEIVQRIVKRK